MGIGNREVAGQARGVNPGAVGWVGGAERRVTQRLHGCMTLLGYALPMLRIVSANPTYISHSPAAMATVASAMIQPVTRPLRPCRACSDARSWPIRAVDYKIDSPLGRCPDCPSER